MMCLSHDVKRQEPDRADWCFYCRRVASSLLLRTSKCRATGFLLMQMSEVFLAATDENVSAASHSHASLAPRRLLCKFFVERRVRHWGMCDLRCLLCYIQR